MSTCNHTLAAEGKPTQRACAKCGLGPCAGDAQPAKARQEGGSHYKDMAIQPIEFIQANGLGFCEGNVVKYVSRWRSKGGIEDLKKARHYIDLLLEHEAPLQVLPQNIAKAP